MNLVDQILFLPDEPKELIKQFVLPIGIIKLQRINRNNLQLKKLGYYKQSCADCSKSYWTKADVIDGLIEIDACASGCCIKNICRFGCKIKCGLGHINRYINYDSDQSFNCNICNQVIYPKIYWNGISEYEYNRRYG